MAAGEEWGGGGGVVLLQITINFHTVVPRIRHDNAPIISDAQTLRSVQRVRSSVDVRNERATVVENLKKTKPKIDVIQKTTTVIQHL